MLKLKSLLIQNKDKIKLPLDAIVGNSYQEMEKQGEMSGYLEEYIGGERIVKAFNHEEKSIEDFKTLNKEFEKTSTMKIIIWIQNNLIFKSLQTINLLVFVPQFYKLFLYICIIYF